MLLGGNTEIYVVAYLSCLSAGLIVVPLNPEAPAPELARAFATVDPSGVIVDEAARATWEALRAELGSPLDHVYVAVGGLVPELEVGVQRGLAPTAGDSPAVLLYTSGTAGLPRPAILTHDNLWASMRSVVSLPIPLRGENHTTLATVPLSHVFGLNVVLNLAFVIGATIVLDEFRSPAHTADLIRDHEVTIVAGPPNLWGAFLRDPDVRPEHFSSVRIAVSGAARLDPRTADQLSDRLGLEVREGYGLTETSGLISTALGTEAPIGSVGQTVPGVEMRLVDDSGDDVLIGDPGEVWVRGPMVSPGYWADDATTRQTRAAGGWLKTGDLAIVDDAGHLAIVDRLKDLIIVSGFNVHPGEVELALMEHPSVEAAGVIGEPDEITGERIVAHVVLQRGAEISEADLRDHCRSELARYKVPTSIVFDASLPTGLGGKLRRSAIS